MHSCRVLVYFAFLIVETIKNIIEFCDLRIRNVVNFVKIYIRPVLLS